MSEQTNLDDKYKNIITFCENCNNLMYTYINEDNQLFNGCKVCLTIKEANNIDKLVTKKQTIDISNIIDRNPYILEDPTLSITKNPQNISCPNDECETNHSGKKFSFISYKYNVNDLKFLYTYTGKVLFCGSLGKTLSI